MTRPTETAVEALPGSESAIRFAMDAMGRIPKPELEAHLTSMLIVFWGALWGTFGTVYARDFIEAQLRGMEGERDIFTAPRTQ